MKSVRSKGQECNKDYMICGFVFVFILLLGVVGIYGCASEPAVKESGSKEPVVSKGNYAPGFARKLLTSNSTSDDYGGDQGDGGDVSNGGDQDDGGDVSNGGDQGDGGNDSNGGDQGDDNNGGDQGNGSDGGDPGDDSNGGDQGDGEGRPVSNRIGIGYGSPCSKDNILVFQGQTQPLPNGIPTYTVNIQNVCLSESCSIANIHVKCGWFSTARLIDPNVFRRIGYNDCLVNNGHPLNPGATLSFQYANTFKYPMSVSSVAC